MRKFGLWSALKGWRSYIIWLALGIPSALLTAASLMDWEEPLHQLLPSVPGPVVGLLAAALGIWLRSITTTPPFRDRP